MIGREAYHGSRRADSWGLASGAATAGTLVALFWESGDSAGGAAALVAVYGGIGASIGVGIDALIKGRHVIYEKPGGAAKVSVSPVLGPTRQGVLVTMRF